MQTYNRMDMIEADQVLEASKFCDICFVARFAIIIM